jgi:two-component system chemotaxis sensor kinase CheA
MDMSQYRDLFVSESHGHIRAFNYLIVQLENNVANKSVIDELFRHAHSLKGMASTMQFNSVAMLAHAMEDLLSKVRSDEFTITPAIVDLLLEGSDSLYGMVTKIESDDDALPDNATLTKCLAGFTTGSTPCHAPVRPSITPPDDAVPAPGRRGNQATSGQRQFSQSDAFKSVRVRTEILDRLVDITGELITTQHRLTDQAQNCPEAQLDEPLDQLSGLLRELRDEVFQARMLPFSFIAESFPRLIRDLARKQGKKISFHIAGKNIELDRGILEEISEPLAHILRNAVDHGMELPNERMAAGKTPGGEIDITVTRDKDHVLIVVSDDGRGMNPAHLITRGIEKGVISSAQAKAMTQEEALMLVCTAGFSTVETVSDISGRGVGMDSVRSAVHNLGGTLSINTDIGKGSSFVLKLPITVSIINALLVECGKLTVAFPVNAIDRVVELRRNDIIEEGGKKVCFLETVSLPLKSLHRLLGQVKPRGGAACVPVIVTGISGTPLGLVTGRILGQREIFVKPLGKPLSRMRAITGGAILGDGRIVFVMDVCAFS